MERSDTFPVRAKGTLFKGMKAAIMKAPHHDDPVLQFIVLRVIWGSFLTLALRIVWQWWPSYLTCGLFWLVSIGRPFVRPDNDLEDRTKHPDPPVVAMVILLIAFCALGLGVLANATVTIANGGYMPVGTHLTSKPTSLWVISTSAHHLRWLGDNYGGFSLGDFLIIFGALSGVVAFKVRGEEPEPAEFKMPASLRVPCLIWGVLAFLSSGGDPSWTTYLMPLMCAIAYVTTLSMERIYRQRDADEREWRDQRRRWLQGVGAQI